MFEKTIEDIKERSGVTARLIGLAVVAGFGLVVTTGFLCAAAFVYVNEQAGPIYACLAGAGIFFVVAAIASGCYASVKAREEKRRAAEEAAAAARAAAAAAAAPSFLTNPTVLAAGLQLARTLGPKRLVPLLAIAGLAVGVMAGIRVTNDDGDDAKS